MMQHAEAETLAAFVDGTLEREDLEAVTSHLQACGECRAMIGEAVAFQREEAKPGRRWVPAAVAAAVVIALIAPFAPRYWRGVKIRSAKQELFASIPNGQRLPGRLSGQEVWRESRTLRGGGEDTDLAEAQRDAAAANLIVAVGNDTSPPALRAKAAALAYTDKPLEALQTLEQIPDRARDAATWNDIAVLRLRTGQGDALAAANKAVEKQPDMPEALFTRATILRYQNEREAVAAYRRYKQVDPHGPWAEEAQRVIDGIQQSQ